MPVTLAFDKMDTDGHGYLTLRDFHINFARLFKFTLRNDQIMALFNEINENESGIITPKEFENFYERDYLEK